MGKVATWFYMLVAAAISAGAQGILLIIVAPSAFNFSHEGIIKLAQACGGMALYAVGVYLKQSPLPILTATSTTTVTKTDTIK